MSKSSTKWERRYEAELEEVRNASVDQRLHPHVWPASTHPDGSETGDPAPRLWNPPKSVPQK